MPLYAYADTIVSSAQPLPELIELACEDRVVTPTFTFLPLTRPPGEPDVSDWIHDWKTLAVARSGGGYLLRFPHLSGFVADFVISEDGSQIGVWPAHDIPAETLRHLLLDQVLPRLLAQQGRLVLHASAVCLDGAIIAFMGISGQGKSTLAASFHTAGMSMLADDGLVMMAQDAQVVALPTYCGLRLYPKSREKLFAKPPKLAPVAHYSKKKRVMLNRESTPAILPLTALYVLERPIPGIDLSAVEISPLSFGDACMALIYHSFELDLDDRAHGARTLEESSLIVGKTPVYSLSFPRDHTWLPAVRAAVLQQCRHPADAIIDYPSHRPMVSASVFSTSYRPECQTEDSCE